MKQLVVLGVMCAIACGGSSKPPAAPPPVANTPAEEAPPAAEPPPAAAPPVADADASTVSDAEFEGLMNKAIAMFNAMGAAADAAGDDCHTLSVGFNQVLDDNRAFIDDVNRWEGNAAMNARAEAWMKPRIDQMMPAMMKIGTATTKCASDAEFQTVMKRMDELK